MIIVIFCLLSDRINGFRLDLTKSLLLIFSPILECIRRRWFGPIQSFPCIIFFFKKATSANKKLVIIHFWNSASTFLFVLELCFFSWRFTYGKPQNTKRLWGKCYHLSLIDLGDCKFSSQPNRYWPVNYNYPVQFKVWLMS